MTELVTAAPEQQATTGWRRALIPALVALIVVYGAALRFDALTLQFGAVKRPAWLQTIQTTWVGTSVPRPSGLAWTHVPAAPHRNGIPTRYTSDPYTYLQYARQMRHFYAAHRREPVFPFVTKVFLGLLRDQDVAVSFASGSFSVLVILATFLLGSIAFSPWVGVGAAAAMAIEGTAISSGVLGLRDDAFTAAVVLSACAMIGYLRAPSKGSSILLGLVGGISCLIRITSLSFLLPGFLGLLLASRQRWKQRLAEVGLAFAIGTLVAAPFMINCWRAFGDPLYSINVHADVYRAAEGHAGEASRTAVEYLTNQARTRPMRTLDTVALGMTTYPFLNKWSGFDAWIPGLGTWLSFAAVIGLLLFLTSSGGRLLVVVLATSLIPYAATWKLAADWRFTEHAYPFFLVAAFLAIARIVRIGAAPSRSLSLLRTRPRLKTVIAWASVLVFLGVASWLLTRTFPVLAAEEALRADESVTIVVGERDGAFFGGGWSAPMGGTLAMRAARGGESVILLPLPRPREYDVILRLDPFPRPLPGATPRLPAIRASVNGHPIGVLQMGWDGQRVGTYRLRVPAGTTRAGGNRLVLAAEPAARPREDAGFAVWYVGIRPAAL